MKDHSKRKYLNMIFFILIMIVLAVNSSYAAGVTLEWDAPTTNADGTLLTNLAGYKVYYGTQSGSFTQNIDVGNVTTYQLTNLTGGLTYFFAVTAYDTSNNESDYSLELVIYIPIPDTVPFDYYCDSLVDEACQPAIKVSKVLLSEDFSRGIPDTWSVSGAWNTENSCGKSIGDPLTEPFVIADSSCMETGVDELITEPFSTSSCNNVEVSYSNQYFWYSGSIEVDVSNDAGISWMPNITTYTDDGYSAANTKELDISSSTADGEAQVRFKYTNNETSGHWAIDDVIVTCQSTKADLSSEVSVPVQETIIITNTGTTSLTTGMIKIEGSDSAEFGLVDNNCSNNTLLPDESCLFDVVFTPVTEGSKSVVISIPSSDPEIPVFDLLLSGTGTLPDRVTPPVFEILANGVSDVINLSRGDVISISIELDPGSQVGANADMWILFEYRNRWYYYNSSSGKWRRGDSTFRQGPLFYTGPVEVFNSSHLSTGQYTFYLIIDTNMNGYQDTELLYSSELQVNIN